MGEEMAISPEQPRTSDGGDGRLLGAETMNGCNRGPLLTFQRITCLCKFRWRSMLFGCEFSHD
jgi:hypothetical protein